MTNRYEEIIKTINSCLIREKSNLLELIIRNYRSYYSFDKFNTWLNIIFILSTILAIILRLAFGSILDNTDNEVTNVKGMVILVLISLSVLSYLITFVRSICNSEKQLQDRRTKVGKSNASKIYGSILYKHYTLQESEILSGDITVQKKREILEQLASFDIHELKFAENHFSLLESVAKSQEGYTLRIFAAVLGALTISLFEFFSVGNLGDKVLQAVTLVFVVNLFSYFYSRDSYASRLNFCVHLLKQAQIMRETTFDNWVKERNNFTPDKFDKI